MKITIGDVTVECVQSSVDHQSDIAALFYYQAEQEQESVDPDTPPCEGLRPGQCALEPLHDLPGRYRIVASGPITLDDGLAAEIIKCCMTNALALCETKGIRSVAFPLTAGIMSKIPASLAAEVTAALIADQAPHCRSLRLIRFTLESAIELNTLPRYLIQAIAKLPEGEPMSAR